MVNFAPKEPLKANTTYEILVRAGGVQDWTGNGTAILHYSRFSTGAVLADGTNSIRVRPRITPFYLPGFPGWDIRGRKLPNQPSPLRDKPAAKSR
jgi:hypothetical protein